MPGRSLREALDVVTRATARPEALGAEELEALEELRDDIERALESTEELARRAPGVRHRAESFLERFETDRPRLVAVLGRLAETLASLGL